MGLSLPQYRLLLFARGGPHRAADLATQASVRRPTLTALVDGLEKEGLLVRRAVDGDRRGICLELTDAGHAALERIERHLEQQMTELLRWDDPQATLAGLAAVIGATERLYARRPADSKGPRAPSARDGAPAVARPHDES